MIFSTGILTCMRMPRYIERTLRSFMDTGGHEASTYIRILDNDARSMLLREGNKAEFRSEPPRYYYAGKTPVRECAAGHARLLRELRECQPEYGLVIEDDVRFARGWIHFLDRILPVIRKVSGGRFILKLFSMLEVPSAAVEGDWVEFLPDRYWGNQATLYPLEVLKMDLPDFLHRQCLQDSQTLPSDSAIGQWCRNHGIATLATNPSLVDHLGDVSAIDTGVERRAWRFQEEVE